MLGLSAPCPCGKQVPAALNVVGVRVRVSVSVRVRVRLRVKVTVSVRVSVRVRVRVNVCVKCAVPVVNRCQQPST